MKVERIKYGKNKPLGMMKEFMEKDLRDGYIGHLDELLPELITDDDVFGKNRRTKHKGNLDLGTRYHVENLTGEYMWWNCETQGNWMDGFVRTAFLADVPEMKEKCEKFVQHYIDTVEEDGYIGIYKEGSRFIEGYESGELWAQSTILRALTAYYEATGKSEVFEIIRRALNRIMEGYPKGRCRPFSRENEPEDITCGGISHGLTITDTFYYMYKETGDKKYIDYAVWLYESAATEPRLQSDISLFKILNDNWKLRSHGVHSYEHIRALAIAEHFDGREDFVTGLTKYLGKVEKLLVPSGGPIGNESIDEHYADATKYAYEYCSIHEFFHSLEFLFELSGDLSLTDKAEHLLYNAAFGAHHPADSSITYLKTDNCYRLISAFFKEDLGSEEYTHYGYKYSPTHQDVAVCCVPNAGRIFPHFVANQWYKTSDGLVKVWYGASQLKETINGTEVTITEKSNYPFCGKLNYEVECPEKNEFTLSFKIPEWCDDFTVSCDYVQEDRLIKITKEWNKDEFVIDFKFPLKKHLDLLGDVFFTYGPNVLALDIPSTEVIVKEHPVKGFFDKEIHPVDTKYEQVSLTNDAKLRDGKVYVNLLQEETGEEIEAELVPMSGTILRRVTFPIKK